MKYISIFSITTLLLFWGFPIKSQTTSDGNLIKTADSFDIYILKIKGAKKFKRLILNSEIFNSYEHLKWGNVKTVSRGAVDQYTLSEFVIEVNLDGSVKDPKVYRVTSSANSDVGEKRWLNVSAAEFEALGYDWDSLYFINSMEASPNFYQIKSPLTYADLTAAKMPFAQPTPTPAPTPEQPKTDTFSPIISNIAATKVLADSATISWITNENANTLVRYGTSESTLSFSATGTVAQTSTTTFSHNATLSGLEPNTKYYYQGISADSSGNVSQITTNSFTATDCYGDVPRVHTTIQEAIDAVVKNGGKICVSAGTFKENILINGKDVSIVGAGQASTIITAAQAVEVFIIKNVAASTSIQNVSIKSGNPYAIRIENASPVVSGNHILNNSGGIRILGNSRPTIVYNIFANNSGAAIAHNGDLGDYRIDHNTFVGNGTSARVATILLDSAYLSSPITIVNNILVNGFTGVYEVSPSNFYLWNNLLYGNESVHLQRQNSFYYSATAVNELGISSNNIVDDPLLDAAYKPKTNSPALGSGTEQSNIGAY